MVEFILFHKYLWCNMFTISIYEQLGSLHGCLTPKSERTEEEDSMKMRYGRKIALILSLALLLPFLLDQNVADALAAASPTFTESKFEIIGVGSTHQLEIKDKISGSTYKWSSSNKKVAKVSSKGLVTAVSKGTATIKCVITLPTKKTKTLSSKITVTVPADEVKINNAVEVNGAHILLVGEKFDFNRDIVPAGSSYITYWSTGGGDESCIRIDDTEAGTVTALKPGKVILKATAAKTTNKDELKKSFINDAIIIEVKNPTATVNSADIIGSTEIRVVFDSPVDPATVIGTNNSLLNSIEITLRKNSKGVLAKDPGALKASLSADGKILTITSQNMLDGEYGINVSSKIKTTGGVAIEEYYRQVTFVDTMGPTIKTVVLDDSGLIATIQFSEAVDFTNLKVSNATLLGSGNADPSTLSKLNNRLNYVASTDKKSLTINLSGIASADYGKPFLVTFSGIKDLAGNTPPAYTLSATIVTDTSPKPQARPFMAVRTSYNTLTVTFDRAIQQPGFVMINNGSMILGVVDSTDNKKVNYTFSDAEAALTGIQPVSVINWSGYNVATTDTFASQPYRFPGIDFTADRTSPVLLNYNFDQETNIMTLAYNEAVTLAASNGIFSSNLRTVTDEIFSGTNITYTKLDSPDNKDIRLLIGNMTLLGSYTFSIDYGFVVDNFRNYNLRVDNITLSNTGGSAAELPGPYLITQSTTNLSQIYVEFANMLDVPSATNITNYNIPGVTILSAAITKNNKTNGATVVLTVADGSIDITLERPITIKGVKGYNGSYSEMETFPAQMVELKDNKKPTLLGNPEYDRQALNVIKLNFSEEMKGTLSVRVTQMGTTPIEIPNVVTMSGKTVTLTLGFIPNTGSLLRIDILGNNLTDVSGNQVAMSPQYSVYVTHN